MILASRVNECGNKNHRLDFTEQFAEIAWFDPTVTLSLLQKSAKNKNHHGQVLTEQIALGNAQYKVQHHITETPITNLSATSSQLYAGGTATEVPLLRLQSAGYAPKLPQSSTLVQAT